MGVVCKDAYAAFVGAAFDAEDDCFAVGVGFVEVGEVGWWGEGEVVEWGDGAGWLGGGGGCHDGCLRYRNRAMAEVSGEQMRRKMAGSRLAIVAI